MQLFAEPDLIIRVNDYQLTNSPFGYSFGGFRWILIFYINTPNETILAGMCGFDYAILIGVIQNVTFFLLRIVHLAIVVHWYGKFTDFIFGIFEGRFP